MRESDYTDSNSSQHTFQSPVAIGNKVAWRHEADF